jgi:hypothetical protein
MAIFHSKLCVYLKLPEATLHRCTNAPRTRPRAGGAVRPAPGDDGNVISSLGEGRPNGSDKQWAMGKLPKSCEVGKIN